MEKAKFSTGERPVVLIKWYTKELVYPEGVNVYRKREGALDWVKLNERPVIRKQNISSAVLAADPDMEAFTNIIQSATPQELQQDMAFLNVLIKSFQSNAFADFMGIYFEDSTVVSGTRYEYKVNRIRNSREILIGISSLIEAESYSPAAPITGIEVFQTEKKLSINWNHEEERFYAVNIYRKSSTETMAIKLNQNPLMITQSPDSLGNLSYAKPMFSEDRNLEEGKSYTYQLTGVGFFENETALSDPVEAKFEDITPPPAPQNLTGKADSMNVYLKWENVNVDDLKGMNVYRSTKSDGPYEVINSSILNFESPFYHDSLKIPGPYYYFIAATDEVGNEGHSNLIFVEVQDVMPPAPPQQLAIKTDTGRISLTWRMGSEPDLSGYYIYRTVDRSQKRNYILLNAEPLKADHFEQDLPKNVKNEFFYYIIAVDTSYNRSKPSDYVSGAMPDILAPEKPFIKTVSYQEDNIVIEWIPNVDSDLAGYHLYRADTSKTFSRININLISGEAYRYTDRDNTGNTDYFYHLVALDSTGNVSYPSKEVYARRTVKQLDPQGQIALKIKHSKRKKHNQLIWNYPIDTPVQGYVVFRGTQENRLKPITGLIKNKNFIDKKDKGEAVEEQYYQVRAYIGNVVIYSTIVKQKL